VRIRTMGSRALRREGHYSTAERSPAYSAMVIVIDFSACTFPVTQSVRSLDPRPSYMPVNEMEELEFP